MKSGIVLVSLISALFSCKSVAKNDYLHIDSVIKRLEVAAQNSKACPNLKEIENAKCKELTIYLKNSFKLDLSIFSQKANKELDPNKIERVSNSIQMISKSLETII